MALEVYRKKRKFGVTAEPRGGRIKRGGDAFVIQKHAATRLHYDLRLELDGVMKSWAVTRGPSLVPGEKRLAVQVEDHPVEYNDFEGTIPKGEYGGGTVLIWDRGRWMPDKDPHKGLAKGSLDFTLEGEKLHGRWHLVRMRHRPGEKRDNWLLIKSDDDAARGAGDPDILQEKPKSVVSGRTIEAIARAEGDAVWHSTRSVAENVKQISKTTKKARKAVPKKKAARKPGEGQAEIARASRSGRSAARDAGAREGRKRPARLRPAATRVAAGDRAERHELRPRGEVRRLPHAGAARRRQGRSCSRARTSTGPPSFSPSPTRSRNSTRNSALIDGEIVVEENGVSDFSALQDALKHNKADRFVYYVFDLLHLDGVDLTG